LHNNVLVIDQSEYIEDRPVPGPFPAFPMTKREKPWKQGWYNDIDKLRMMIGHKAFVIKACMINNEIRVFED
jgi:hypothetical protein